MFFWLRKTRFLATRARAECPQRARLLSPPLLSPPRKFCFFLDTAAQQHSPPHTMVIDWDDLFAYTTTRSVTVRHRYLGLTYYSLLTLVLVYIFGIQIALEKKYNVQLDVDGSIQANVEGVGAAALMPLSELAYCNRTYGMPHRARTPSGQALVCHHSSTHHSIQHRSATHTREPRLGQATVTPTTASILSWPQASSQRQASASRARSSSARG